MGAFMGHINNFFLFFFSLIYPATMRQDTAKTLKAKPHPIGSGEKSSLLIATGGAPLRLKSMIHPQLQITLA